MRKLTALTLTAMLVLTSSASFAFEQSSVTLKIGFGPGLGFDVAGRLAARHLGRFLPGNPSIVVQNVEGGASLVLAKQLQRPIDNDGSVLGMVNSSLVSASVLTPETIDFDPTAVQWVGALGDSPRICVVAGHTGIEDIEDFVTKDIAVAASAKGSKFQTMAAAVGNMYDAKVKVVLGFSTVAEIDLAMERGEIGGLCGLTLSSFMTSGMAQTKTPIGTLTTEITEGELTIPSFMEGNNSELDAKAVKLLVRDDDMFAPLLLPAGTPEDIVQVFRDAFAQMIEDEEFLADAAKVLPGNTASTADEVEALVDEMVSADPATIARARELVQ